MFAVETKGRPKMSRGAGRAGSTVSYDGKSLQFPAWRDTKSLDQARANANWLTNWLSRAVGERIVAHPVVLLPGWWVDRVGRGDILVGNAKEIGRIVWKDRTSDPLSESLQTRIAHQLDQRCRNLDPKAFADS